MDFNSNMFQLPNNELQMRFYTGPPAVKPSSLKKPKIVPQTTSPVKSTSTIQLLDEVEESIEPGDQNFQAISDEVQMTWEDDIFRQEEGLHDTDDDDDGMLSEVYVGEIEDQGPAKACDSESTNNYKLRSPSNHILKTSKKCRKEPKTKRRSPSYREQSGSSEDSIDNDYFDHLSLQNHTSQTLPRNATRGYEVSNISSYPILDGPPMMTATISSAHDTFLSFPIALSLFQENVGSNAQLVSMFSVGVGKWLCLGQSTESYKKNLPQISTRPKHYSDPRQFDQLSKISHSSPKSSAKRTETRQPWSKKELRLLHNLKGRNWEAIFRHFPDRTPGAVRTRMSMLSRGI